MSAQTRRSVSCMGAGYGQVLVAFSTVAFLYFAGEVFEPLALSVLLAFALTPVAARLERLGLPRAGAAVLTLVIVMGVMGGVGSVVTQQLTALATQLPDYQGNIESKLAAVFDPKASDTSERFNDMVEHVTAQLDTSRPDEGNLPEPVRKVKIVPDVSLQERLRAGLGPYLEWMGVFGFVLVLVLFMIVGRENLRDRIVALFGHRHVGLTTRTMEEIGARISRYLATVALLNSGYGLLIAIGLALIGVPYAVLWGTLAALLRFIPYVGPTVAFALPVVFAAAHFPGWRQVLEVIALFSVFEVILNSYVEPVVFSKSTGLWALGLLVAALFWTWLWGPMGLLLSTPLTVCLAVTGKYVPGLGFFATLLGEEADLAPHLRFYQRIVALDRDRAISVVRDELETRSRAEVFDAVLVPALVRAGRDVGQDRLDESEHALLLDVTSEILDELDAAANELAHAMPDDPIARVVGLASDQADALVLRMVGQCLRPSRIALEIPEPGASPLQLRETLDELTPAAVLISHLPPEGLASARYLASRLRVKGANPPQIFVGLWGYKRGGGTASQRLGEAGAHGVVWGIVDARDRLLRAIDPSRVPQEDTAPLPA